MKSPGRLPNTVYCLCCSEWSEYPFDETLPGEREWECPKCNTKFVIRTEFIESQSSEGEDDK